MIGTIFDIQRFSVHDGPGIRTTVFMKGCPLRCKWCHNPEGLSRAPQLQFFEEKCIGCKRCGSRSELSDAEKCPAEALSVCGREVDEDEVLKEILKDRCFYAEDGGVTFSGGECLLQADFVAAVLNKAKAQGFRTAIDTSGYVPWDSIEKTLDCCDLYLYDVKCITPSLHKSYTGVDNALIIENLKKLNALGKDIWVRTPIIPDFNNTETEICAIADLVASLSSVKQVTLMPYHTLGASKYKTLGIIYPYDTDKRITEDELSLFSKIFLEKGIALR
ncbi:MAG: glycyl-radical enzyme activating protein [Clostridia bacterium]|nr:glycyl-radical enzyme activating protein [Clostridia bacterium]